MKASLQGKAISKERGRTLLPCGANPRSKPWTLLLQSPKFSSVRRVRPAGRDGGGQICLISPLENEFASSVQI